MFFFFCCGVLCGYCSCLCFNLLYLVLPLIFLLLPLLSVIVILFCMPCVCSVLFVCSVGQRSLCVVLVLSGNLRFVHSVVALCSLCVS